MGGRGGREKGRAGQGVLCPAPDLGLNLKGVHPADNEVYVMFTGLYSFAAGVISGLRYLAVRLSGVCLSFLRVCICPSGVFVCHFGGDSVYLSLERSLGVFVSLGESLCEAEAVTYPKEVAQGHGEADGQGRGAQVVSTTLIGRGKDAEHQLQGQEELHRDRLATCCVVAELRTERGNSERAPALAPSSCQDSRAASGLAGSQNTWAHQPPQSKLLMASSWARGPKAEGWTRRWPVTPQSEGGQMLHSPLDTGAGIVCLQRGRKRMGNPEFLFPFFLFFLKCFY